VSHEACGTYAGYQRHSRRGEYPCEECKAANRAYVTEYRRSHVTQPMVDRLKAEGAADERERITAAVLAIPMSAFDLGRVERSTILSLIKGANA
jgi:hypothetical protein